MSRISRKLSIAAITITFIGLIGIMSSASALTITPAATPVWFGIYPVNPNGGDVADIVEYPGILFGLYKQDEGAATDTGLFASSYVTTFFNTQTDPQDATIEYVGGPIINGIPLYLLVKDGAAHNPVWYIFNLNNVNGVAWNDTDDIELKGFWPLQGAISHVSIFGPTPVPEPTTLLLLGSGLVALCLVSRKFKR